MPHPTQLRPARLKLYVDGGCRPNPGMMETAVVARGVADHRDAIGHGTNTDAEWLALIHALEFAAGLGATDVELLGDSAGVIEQAKGVLPCRTPALRAHHARFTALAAGFTSVRVRRIPRSRNLAGIALAARRR